MSQRAETWFDQYAAYAAAIAIRILGHGADVEDVVQDVFIAAHGADRAGRLDAVESPKAWVATVTTRICQRRLSKRRFWLWLDGTREEGRYDDLAAPQLSPEQRALMADLYRSLDSLHPKVRTAFVLHRLMESTIVETAEFCETSVSTVKRRVAKADAFIKKRFAHTPQSDKDEEGEGSPISRSHES
jgi:RNA polymerase sigma-70 factor (ECF subfamily)